MIGFVLAWFSLRAADLVERGPTPSYPFGLEALAPLVVAIQALVLLGTFGYAAVDAVGVLLMIRINAEHRRLMTRRRVSCLDDYLDRVNLLLWPRFKVGEMDLLCV